MGQPHLSHLPPSGSSKCPTRQDLRLRYFPPGPERRRTLGSEDRDTGRQTADGSS